MKCPHCGKEVDQRPQDVLLQHINIRLANMKETLSRYEKSDERRFYIKRKTIAKWQSWSDWVTHKIEEEQSCKEL